MHTRSFSQIACCMTLGLLLSACSGGSGSDANIDEDSPTVSGEQDQSVDSGSATAQEATTGQDSPARPGSTSNDGSEEMSYYFKRGSRGATLSYGVPNTDNIALTIRCPAGGIGKTALVSFRRPDEIISQRPDDLTISSGGASKRYEIAKRGTQLGTVVEVNSSPRSAPLHNFSNGSSLKIDWGEESISVPSGEAYPQIAEFFEACSP